METSSKVADTLRIPSGIVFARQRRIASIDGEILTLFCRAIRKDEAVGFVSSVPALPDEMEEML